MMNNHSLLYVLMILISACGIARAAEIKQNKSSSFIDESTLIRSQSNLPDERILWQLFHAQKYQQLTRQIEHLKQQYPEWQLPNDLINALHDKKNATSKSTAKTTHSNRKKATNYQDPCPNLLSRWNSAEVYLKRNRPANALDTYHQIIVQCPAKNQMQTLEKAQSRLEYSDFVQLLELSSQFLPSFYLDRLKYDALKVRYFGNKPLSSEEHELAVRDLGDLVMRFKDDNVATVIGWRYFNLKIYTKAQDWFQNAVFWNPSNENATYGQLMSLEKAGNYDQALAIFAALNKPSTQTKAIATHILKAKAWQNFDRNQLNLASENVSQAQKISGSDPEIKELNAWIANQSGQYANAAKLFDELYQQSPGRKYARSYIQNQAQADRSVMSRKAEQSGGILLDEYNQYHGQELYDRKQFQSANKLAPDTFPKLENIASPYADVGGYMRYKSGENGLGRLDLFKAPIATGSYTVDGNNNFKLDLSRVQLYSGSPEKCVSPIGSLVPNGVLALVGQTRCGANTPFSPTQQLNDAVEIDLSYHRDGWFSPFVKVGSTPIGGIINPAVTFDVGFLHQAGFGNWGLQAYSQPVRQSILSYTGIKDPYRGPDSQVLEWGRVLRTGIRPSIFYRFNDNWNASGAFDLALLEGKNVEENTTVSASASFARNLRISGFDYFNVGPSFNYEHFDKNLSHFTYGHGGYFSPVHYFNIGAGINFLTEEGRPYVIKGRLTAGFQDITESSVAWFPLGYQAHGFYDKSHQSGEAFDFELKGVWLISPNFQLGAGGAIRKTGGYDDYTGGMFARYYFDGRKASFSSDIPASMFSSMY